MINQLKPFLEYVKDGEDHGPHWNIGHINLVVEAKADAGWGQFPCPGHIQETPHDQKYGRDQLNWCLDTATDTMRHSGKHLESRCPHVVSTTASSNVPQVDGIALETFHYM